jgi:hypothetical protein
MTGPVIALVATIGALVLLNSYLSWVLIGVMRSSHRTMREVADLALDDARKRASGWNRRTVKKLRDQLNERYMKAFQSEIEEVRQQAPEAGGGEVNDGYEPVRRGPVDGFDDSDSE